MTRLIFVRHGETVYNKREILQGITDSPLTKEGRKQIKKIAETLKNEKIDAIFSSDLERCRKTTQAINKYHGLKIRYTKILRERNYGIFEGKHLKHVKKERKKIGLPRYRFRPPCGESYEDVKKRLKPFLRRLIKAYKKKTVLIVTHGDLMRIAAHLLVGRPMKNLAKMKVKRGSINIFEEKNGKL